MKRWHALLPAVVAGLALVPAVAGPATAAREPQNERLLVFSKTAGFRHASIPNGVAALTRMAPALGVVMDFTEDAAAFTGDNLARYKAVVFLNTTGDVLDDAQQASFEQYIRGGGGFVGVHAATDTEFDWPWFGRLAGAYFDGHPRIQSAMLDVVDATHPSTRGLPSRWQRTDEWYDFRSIEPGIRVLITIDETSYTGGKTGAKHPMAWCHEFDGGRAFYTGGGHTAESYTDPVFLGHLAGGISWVLGRPS